MAQQKETKNRNYKLRGACPLDLRQNGHVKGAGRQRPRSCRLGQSQEPTKPAAPRPSSFRYLPSAYTLKTSLRTSKPYAWCVCARVAHASVCNIFRGTPHRHIRVRCTCTAKVPMGLWWMPPVMGQKWVTQGGFPGHTSLLPNVRPQAVLCHWRACRVRSSYLFTRRRRPPNVL